MSEEHTHEHADEQPKPVRIAINGFGRIGRAFFRLAAESFGEAQIVAVNDLAPIDSLLYLLQYDTAQGYGDFEIDDSRKEEGVIVIDETEIRFTADADPKNLPWEELDIDVVIESTGFFTNYQDAHAHIGAGAKHVVISAPAKGDRIEGVSDTVLMGINEDSLKTCPVTSNASCTTNSGSPVMQILSEKIGIEKAMLTTIHGYTSTQSLVDRPHKKDLRRGRAAAQNIIPTTTGAAKATALVIKDLENKFDGMAMRVPVITGSIADLTILTSRDTSVEEINKILTEAADEERWHNIFAVNTDPVVSSDIVGSSYASIADLNFTKVVDGNLVKVLAWYDNEMGYTGSLLRHAVKAGKAKRG